MWSLHECAIVEEERRKSVESLPAWMRLNSGMIELEETTSGTRSMGVNDSTPRFRLFLLITHRECDPTVDIGRRRKVGVKIEVCKMSQLYDEPSSSDCVAAYHEALDRGLLPCLR